jgi:hypothetical protein
MEIMAAELAIRCKNMEDKRNESITNTDNLQ